MARLIRERQISSLELITAHLEHIGKINPRLNAVVDLLAESALRDAQVADAQLVEKKSARCQPCGPLHGVPISIKDSIDVRGTRCTAGTLGRKHAAPAGRDATLVHRLRAAGAIPIAKTNLPDLLFAFESDNLVYGRTNNPYDLARTPGGSSGGESALIAACGSPLGLGSDAAGSVRLPAAFCGIAGIKPTSGRLPRTGHVPPPGGWIEALWQIGPMARHTEDLILALHLLAAEDGEDFTSPPVPLLTPLDPSALRVAFFTHNGFAPCLPPIKDAVTRCAEFLARTGMHVEERRPPCLDQAFELELGLLGADGVDGIDAYLRDAGSTQLHPLLTAWLDRMRPLRATASELAARWTQWDYYRTEMARFFEQYDALLCPVYTQPALEHGASVQPGNFEGFSYTMAWNVAGAPAATIRCSESAGLPINVQVIAKPWRDLTALAVCQLIETEFGGWRAPHL
ncbi:MAG TPA: amidase [Bryobacteraceae bacterium]|nr:amidase [Bryobacteraceae bacterium]